MVAYDGSAREFNLLKSLVFSVLRSAAPYKPGKPSFNEEDLSFFAISAIVFAARNISISWSSNFLSQRLVLLGGSSHKGQHE